MFHTVHTLIQSLFISSDWIWLVNGRCVYVYCESRVKSTVSLFLIFLVLLLNTFTHSRLRSGPEDLGLTGHDIRYALLVLGLTPSSCINSLWSRFNKVLETFLTDFGPYWHDCIMQLLQICHLHLHDVNLSCHHIPKVLSCAVITY